MKLMTGTSNPVWLAEQCPKCGWMVEAVRACDDDRDYWIAVCYDCDEYWAAEPPFGEAA